MNFYAITALVAATALIVISIITFFRAPKSIPAVIFTILNFFILCWVIGCLGESVTLNPNKALFFDKLLYSGAIFSPVVYVTLIFSITNSLEKKWKVLLTGYVLASVFFIFNIVPELRPLFISDVVRKFGFRFISIPNYGWYLYLCFYFIFGSLLLLELGKAFIKAGPAEKEKLKYFFISSFVVTVAGVLYFCLVIGILRLPIDNFFTITYAIVTAYAIIKHRLIDVKLVITRLGIFIFVYSVILGIPICIGLQFLGTGLWLLPISIMAFFATIGPFIYLYIQKRAEDRLLQEQHRYQATLRQASAGMGKIKDLGKLLNMIVYVLTHAIQIEHALVYIYDEGQKSYVLGASKKKSGHGNFIKRVEKNSLLIKYFLENNVSIIYEEIKQKSVDYKDSRLDEIGQLVASLHGALIVPIFIDKDLIAIVVMGKKESGKAYTNDDLGVFSILANQTALAIENAKFYEDMKMTHQQLFQAEKMATIGTMADGLSHQINNRFHALGFIAGDALDTIQMSEKEQLTPERMKEVMSELSRAFTRVQENVVQGGEIVQGLLKYTRKGDAGFTAVAVQVVFKSALEMAQFKIKTDQLKIVHNYDPATIPKIKANFTQLQEVFFNLIDNGYDAMMQRKNEKEEPGYQPTLIVHVTQEAGYAQVVFEDNGIGVKDEDMTKLFTPFFTTKLSSKKGTGLGLYVIKKIVEDNHDGKVEMISKYMQGTQMKLRLPIAVE